MKIKNIGTGQIVVGSNATTVVINREEEIDVSPEIWGVLMNSHYRDSVKLLDASESVPMSPCESTAMIDETPVNKREVNFRMPLLPRSIYDGYGRLSGLFLSHLNFDTNSDTIILIGHPQKYVRQPNDRKVILFTMFEADKIPDRWVEFANQSDGLIVPTEWVKEVFEKSGVKVPIKVVYLGTDNFDIVRPTIGKDHPFKFFHQNSFIHGDQKGWQLAIKAFIKAFGDDPSVELVLKGRDHPKANDPLENLPQQKNIKYVIQNMERHVFDAFVEDVACFVFPSRGEGFGLPPIEMMARGIPTILTDAHSMHTFAKYGIPLKVTGEPTPTFYAGRVWEPGIGNWVTPDVDDLAAKMKLVYNDYPKYKKQAIKNREIIKKMFSTDVMFDNFIEAVRELSI